MPFAPKAPIDLALKERIRIAYYEEERTIEDVEKLAGVGRSTLYRWFHTWEWPLRKPMRSRGGGAKDAPVFRPLAPGLSEAAVVPNGAPTGGAARGQRRPESLKVRLRRLVEHRIAVLEHETMSGLAVDPEANARAIELNARTLATIEKLSGEAEPCPVCRDQPPARSLNELRDELRRHLERVQREQWAKRGFVPDGEEDETLSGVA
jgi:hypothetical protein